MAVLMFFKTKNMLFIIMLGLFLGFTVQAHALPMLLFDSGSIEYTTDGFLHVKATVNSSEGLTSDVSGAILEFYGFFISSSSNSNYTTGVFESLYSTLNPDISIIVDSDDPDLLLSGQFSELEMRGGNDGNFGALYGQFALTGGSLEDEFTSPSNLMSLVLSLNIPFNADMFNNSFTGGISGWVESAYPVPEPATWILFCLGLTAFGCVQKKNGLEFLTRGRRKRHAEP